MTPPTPKTIGRYVVIERLGHGGMGVVYRAWDPELRRMVALKVISGSRDEPVEDRVFERFAREARSAASLAHPNIVTIHDFGRDAGRRPYIVMELVDGASLAQMIQGGTALDVVGRVRLLIELCEGLAYAHEHGVIHRDIKPANLMITSAGVLKILDFGLARLTDDLADPSLTQTGALIGTPRYMSPEQVSGLPPDTRSDVFSVAAVMYELFTGRTAFGGASAALVRLRILQDTPQPIDELVPGFPDALAAIVAKAMDKDRTRRYQGLAEVAADLRRWENTGGASESMSRETPQGRAPNAEARPSAGLSQVLGEWEDAVGRVLDAPTPPRAASAPPAAAPRSSRPPARRRWPWLAVAVAVAAAIGAGGVYLVRHSGVLARLGITAPAESTSPPDESTPPAAGDRRRSSAGSAAERRGDTATGRASGPGAGQSGAPSPGAAGSAASAPTTTDAVPTGQSAARCREILQRVGIGEELTASDRDFLREQCRNRSR